MAPPGEYSELLLEHFRNPRNVGEVERWDAEARVTSPLHGDTLRLTFELDGERIRQVRFQCLGCTVAIAAGSVATVLLAGRTRDEALALTDADVAEALGGIPETRRACSILVAEAVRAALAPDG
jgi:nitrogen fixation NifU-like protein